MFDLEFDGTIRINILRSLFMPALSLFLSILQNHGYIYRISSNLRFPDSLKSFWRKQE